MGDRNHMAPMQKTITYSIVILAIFSAIGSSIYIAYHLITQSGLKIIKYEHFLQRIIEDDPVPRQADI